jgi:hypothetical protein
MGAEKEGPKQGGSFHKPHCPEDAENDQSVRCMHDQREDVVAQWIQSKQRIYQEGENDESQRPVLPKMIWTFEHTPDISPIFNTVGEKEKAVAFKKVVILPKKQKRLGCQYYGQPLVLAQVRHLSMPKMSLPCDLFTQPETLSSLARSIAQGPDN